MNAASLPIEDRAEQLADGWRGEPEPLRRAIAPPRSFPTEALGQVLGDAARAMHNVVRSPLALCGNAVLASASLAVQPHADVVIDGRVMPTSLFLLTIADSGERKSGTDKHALRAHREVERHGFERYQKDLAEHRIRASAHQAAMKRAERSSSEDEIRAAMRECGAEPEPPLHPQLIAGDPTLEGLHKLLQAGRGSLGLFSDEGGQFFGGHSMSKDHVARGAAGLSSLWDASAADRVRAGDGAVRIYDKRVALHLMLQPVIAERVLSDPILSGQGMLSRCLVAWPESTAGSRLYVEKDLNTEPAMGRYWARMTQILTRPFPLQAESRNELNPRRLQLATSAKAAWIACHDSIEKRTAREGEYSQIRSFSSKAPEQILRIAGVLAVVEDLEARTITLEHIRGAADLVDFYLSEAARLASTAETSPATRRALALLAWCQERRKTLVHSSELLQFGPACIRERGQLRDAFAELERAGWAELVEEGAEVDGKFRRCVWRVRGAA